MNKKCLFSSLLIPLCASCASSFNTNVSPNIEISLLKNKAFISNTDADYRIVIKNDKTIDLSYKLYEDDIPVLKTDSFSFEMASADDYDIESYNNLLWHIEDFNTVRFYRIDFDFSYFLPIGTAYDALTDTHFQTFMNFPETIAQNYLFHFKSIKDIPATFAFVKNPTSNVMIVNGVWGTANVDKDGNPQLSPEPSVFYLND